MHYRATTIGRDQFDLPGLLERYANVSWLPDHARDEDKRRMILEDFRRQALHDLELLDITDTEAELEPNA